MALGDVPLINLFIYSKYAHDKHACHAWQ